MTSAKSQSPTIPLPRIWPESVKSAVLQVIALAQFAAAHTCGWAANSVNSRVRLKADNDRLKAEVGLLHEEIRIKDARLKQVPASRRPHYAPPERMAVLQLKTARNWSLEQTAKTFLITAATIASWLKRLDEKGAEALVQLPGEPPNKFPEFVGQVVRRLKTLCPSMGKVKIAQTLARAGLHLGATTVGRMLKDQNGKPAPQPAEDGPSAGGAESNQRVVTAKYPNHLWHVDLTLIPTGLGLCCSWLPFALPQRWPFCWWLAVAVDHFSRRAMGVTALREQPTSAEVRGFLGRAIAKANETPKYIVCDRGAQFDCEGFRHWCARKGIKPPRYGAIGQHGSIAVVERFILTLKSLLACLVFIPYRREAFQRECNTIVDWYNAARPHTWLRGRTPDEVYHRAYPVNRKPRYECRSCWPRGSPCARPWSLVKGQPGVCLQLQVSYLKRRKHLPLVALSRAA